jgi:hypothetical protein
MEQPHRAIYCAFTSRRKERVNIAECQATPRNIPKDNHLHTRRRQNLNAEICLKIYVP